METKELTQICEIFFTRFWLEYESIDVEMEQEDIYRVTLKTQDSALIIGPHGRNLEYFSHILKLIFSKKLGKITHLHFEVNDYLKEKDAKLYRFLDGKIDYLRKTWNELMLPQFSAYERKKVHSYITDKKTNIYTESRGEGVERRIFLCLKHEKMTIDLDGDDI